MMQYSISGKYGFNIYWDDDDSFVGKSVVADNYEPYESDLFLSFVQSDSVILDVGANIGYYSMLAAKKLYPTIGKVFAFEPEKRNFELLERNITANNFQSVIPVKAAIAEEDGIKDLFLSIENKGDHQLYFSADRERQTVSVIKIDSFIKEQRIQPTIIKVDAQGYDYYVLKSAQEYIANSLKLVLFTEFWDHGNKNAGVDSKEYFDFLQNTFSQVLYIDEDVQDCYPITFDFLAPIFARHDNHGHGNFLCIK